MSKVSKSVNPFPGLRSFRQDEDYLFFGREEQTIELLQRLANNRFVSVVGTSGSGKSSLVRCGLLSELLGGKMLQAGASWEVAVTHPGGNPLALLTEALLEADLYDVEEDHARENLLATLSRSHFGLVEAIRQSDVGEDTNFLLVVDQFEEIFRFREAGKTQQEAAAEFVSLLLAAAGQDTLPIYVVLTMRSDFIGECSQFEGLAEMVNRGEFLIPRLTREQYKRVIEGPVKVAGGKIAPRLLQRLLNDLGQQADQLPCLQHALMRTWDVWTGHGESEALDLEDYQRVGRMAQALSLHADEVYQALANDRERQLCEGAFQALTVKESENRGIRRPQRLGTLCEILEVSSGELIPVIDAYRQQGVTFLMPPSDVDLDENTIIDISHESLMRVWTRLRHWVDDEAQAAGIYRRLAESAALHGEGEAALFREPELGLTLAWRDNKHPNEAWAVRYRPGFTEAMRFLETSQEASEVEEREKESARQLELEQAKALAEAQRLRVEEQKRSAGRLRWLVTGSLAMAVAAFVAFIIAQRASADAEQARMLASKGEDVAQRENYRSTIRLAESMLQGDDEAKYGVADLLWDADRDLRGWEWGHLMAQSTREEWSLQTDQGGLDAVAGSADGRYLASAGVDGTIVLWDSWTREKLWQQTTGRVRKLTLDPGGRFVAVGSADESLPHFVILELATGRVVYEARQPGKADLVFSTSGTDLVVLSSESHFEENGEDLRTRQLTRYATGTWEQLASVPINSVFKQTRIFADAAGAFIGVHYEFNNVSPDSDKRFSFLDATTLLPTTELEALNSPMRLPSRADPILHSGLGQILYTKHQTLYRRSSPPPYEEKALDTLSSEIRHIALDVKSGTVIAADLNGTVLVIDADGEQRTLWHGTPIRGFALFPDGRFVTGGAGGLIKCWKLGRSADLNPNVPKRGVPSRNGKYVAFTNDGQRLLYQNWMAQWHYLMDLNSTSRNSYIRPDREGRLPRQDNYFFPLMIRPGTDEVFDADETGLSFYPLESGAGAEDITHSLAVTEPMSAAIDASGRMLVVAHRDHVSVFDLERDQRLPDPAIRGATRVAINPSGTRAAAHSADGLHVWDVSTGALLNRLESPWLGAHLDFRQSILKETAAQSYTVLDFPYAPAFHPKGEWIACIDSEANLVIWDSLRGQKYEKEISPPTGVRFWRCLFTPDGKRLMAACSDWKIRLFDWRIGEELVALSDTDIAKTLAPLAVSPDGLTIAYGGFNPPLRIARALPHEAETQRDEPFYHALDDLRVLSNTFRYRDPVNLRLVSTGRVAQWLRRATGPRADQAADAAAELLRLENLRRNTGPQADQIADAAESLGDIARRRGKDPDAISHYTTAVTYWKEEVVKDLTKVTPQNRLAAVYEKLNGLAAADQVGIASEAVAFWTQPLRLRRPLLAFLAELAEQHLSLEQQSEAALRFELTEAVVERTGIAPGREDKTPRQHLIDLGWFQEPVIEEVIPEGSNWKFLDDGSDQGVTWREPEFNDSSWSEGPSPLGYNTKGTANSAAAAKTSVGYGLNQSNKHMTTYFRAPFELADVDIGKRGLISLGLDDGAVVFLNGQEVGRPNMDSGRIDSKMQAREPRNREDYFEIRVPTSFLRPGRNVVAVEVHQATPGSSDLYFDLALKVETAAPTYPAAPELTRLEEALKIPPYWRSLLWKRRAEFFSNAGNKARADECLERAQLFEKRLRVGFLIESRRHEEALVLIEEVEQEVGESWKETRASSNEHRALLEQKEICYRALPQDAAVKQAWLFPPRTADLDPKLIDLSAHYNGSLFDGSAWAGSAENNLARLPESFVPLKGVGFDLRGAIQLESGPLRDGQTTSQRNAALAKIDVQFPFEVTGIKVGQAAPALHFLMSCQNSEETTGAEVARLVMHYEDATSETMPVKCDDDVSDFWQGVGTLKVAPAQIGWRGGNDRADALGFTLALSELIWQNPHPNKTITTIDFISAKAKAAPFLVGITLE